MNLQFPSRKSQERVYHMIVVTMMNYTWFLDSGSANMPATS